MATRKLAVRAKKISVHIYSGKYGAVNCQVDKIPVVEAGQEVVWGSNESNLGACSKVMLDVSVGNEPKFQVKTAVSDNYCPISVELKINNMYFCGETNQSTHRRGFFYGTADNHKRHVTNKGQCQ